jgi:FkbH-like protein
MMEQLEWLPAHPDLAGAISAARKRGDPVERLATGIRLAGYRRDFVATERLGRVVSVGLNCLDEAQIASLGLRPLRLALLSSHTVDHLAAAIRVAGLHRRLAIDLYIGLYGQYRQLLLADDPALTSFAPQVVLLALDAIDLAIDLPLDASETDVAMAIDGQVEHLRRLWRCAKERFGAQVIQQTIVPMEPSLFGSYEALVPASPGSLIERLNTAIRTAAKQDSVLLVDLAWHAAHEGIMAQLPDPVRWHHAKQLVSPALAPFYGDLVARVAAAIVGLSRKCLVLDLDNTLWGGVVGDEGVEGIRLGPGSAEGEAFLAFQRYLAQLGRRGVILTICSKNDPAIAEAAFKDHPEMALRRNELAAFVANWDDKASNIRAIARMLEIATDSMVFIDDNPAERDIIRRELFEIAVPELPEDVAHYPRWLSRTGYFEPASFTHDDTTRGRSYALNAARRAELERATDLNGYLKSLEMTMTAAPISPKDLPRTVQLINKTNQFNLTTRRYTEAEVQRLIQTPGAVALCLRLRDRFGDNGLISVIFARPDAAWPKDVLLIETWLMSCRVLGRQVEPAALEVLASEAQRQGAKGLIGEYRSTPRNGLVADHYAKLGFRPCAAPGSTSESSYWRYDIGNGPRPVHFIQVESRA